MKKVESLLAGSGKAQIVMEKLPFPLKQYTEIHDSLYVRAVWLSSAIDVLIISVEMTSLPTEYVEELKDFLYSEYDLLNEHIWITVTHTMSAPHASKEAREVRKQLKEAIKEAVKRAYENKRPCKIGFNRIPCSINSNRNIESPAGWWIGKNAKEYSNHLVKTVKIEDSKNKNTVAILFNADLPPSVLDQSKTKNGGRAVSADLTGEASRNLEKNYGKNTVAIFLLGAAGDQCPVFQARSFFEEEKMRKKNNDEDGYKLVKRLGSYLATAVEISLDQIISEETTSLKVIKEIVNVPEKVMPVPTKRLRPGKQFDFSLTGKKLELDIEAIMIGSILLVGMKPELNSSFGEKLIKASPLTQTMICTMVNGGMKYLPEPSDYQRITYSAMNTMLGPGSSSIVYKGVFLLYEKLFRH